MDNSTGSFYTGNHFFFKLKNNSYWYSTNKDGSIGTQTKIEKFSQQLVIWVYVEQTTSDSSIEGDEMVKQVRTYFSL